jgi:hypothetical protein
VTPIRYFFLADMFHMCDIFSVVDI